MSSLLIIYAWLDCRNKVIPNRIILIGLCMGTLIVILSGHLLQYMVLHITSGLFMLILGYTLFRIGAFGGADVKTVLTIAIVSPGIEFASWNDPILEAVFIAGLQLGAMMGGGYLYSRMKAVERRPKVIPLIPVLLGAYLVLQLLVLS